MPPEKTRFLIVGGGLAGLLLAWRLRAHDLVVLGGESLPPASDVSAGVLNPVTGGRITLMDDYSIYRDAARDLYRSIPGGDKHFHEAEIRRYFMNELEARQFEERKNIPEYQSYLSEIHPPGKKGPAHSDSLGSFTIRNVARVEPVPLLETIRNGLSGRYLPKDANWNSLKATPEGLSLNGIQARQIICCEGVGVLANPLFRWLPFRPVQGETLTVRLPAIPDCDEILHHRKWVISLGDHIFRIGSTYRRGSVRREGIAADPRPPQPEPSPEAHRELLDACRTIFDLSEDPEVIDHRSGIRPCSRDRVPYLGPHPKHENLYIFNGLGSKGALLAPHLSEILADHLVDRRPLDPAHSPARMIPRGFEPTDVKIS